MNEKVVAKSPAVANRNMDMDATMPPMLLRCFLDEIYNHRDQTSRPMRRPRLNRKPDDARTSRTMPHAARRSQRYLNVGSSPALHPGIFRDSFDGGEEVAGVAVGMLMVELLLLED